MFAFQFPFLIITIQVMLVILWDQKIIPMIPYYPALFSAGKVDSVTMADLPTGLAFGIMYSILLFPIFVYLIICFLFKITLNSLNDTLRSNQEHTFITAPQ